VSKKAWIIFAAICIVLLGSLVFFSSKDKIDVSNVNQNTIIAASQQSGNIADHVFGQANSKVLFVEYGDYQCPGCGGLYPTLKTITEKYQGQIAFVFRNFPITTLHPNARVAAAAAEAAGLQGKYWEMHNKLYENQSAWESLSSDTRVAYLTTYAKDLGLNTTKFQSDLSSDAVSAKISFDQAVAEKIGVNSTPTLYLDGKLVDQTTWGDPSKLEAAIVDAMKANNIALPVTK
jgi:protein-disulfide isomerase